MLANTFTNVNPILMCQWIFKQSKCVCSMYKVHSFTQDKECSRIFFQCSGNLFPLLRSAALVPPKSSVSCAHKEAQGLICKLWLPQKQSGWRFPDIGSGYRWNPLNEVIFLLRLVYFHGLWLISRHEQAFVEWVWMRKVLMEGVQQVQMDYRP